MLSVWFVAALMWVPVSQWKDTGLINCQASTFGYATLGNNRTTAWLLANTSAWGLPPGSTINETFLEFELWTLDPGKASFESAYVDGAIVLQNHVLSGTSKFFPVDTNRTIPGQIGLRVKNLNAGKTIYVGVSCVRFTVIYDLAVTTTATTGILEVAPGPPDDEGDEEELYDTWEEVQWFVPAFCFLLIGLILVLAPPLLLRGNKRKRHFELVNEEFSVDSPILKAQIRAPEGNKNIVTVKSTFPQRHIDDIKHKYLCPWLGQMTRRGGDVYDLYAIGKRVRFENALYRLERQTYVKYPLKWFVKICVALRELHAHGLVHGNLTHHCVWVNLEDNTAALCDYRDPSRQGTCSIYSDIFDLGTLFEFALKDTGFFTDQSCDAFVASCHDPDVRQRPSLEACEQTIRSYIRQF